MSQHARPVGPTTNNAAPFGAEMVQGARPDRSPQREDWRRTSRRSGLSVAQTTHVQAAFIPAMAQGSSPARSRLSAPTTRGSSEAPQISAQMTPEMWAGALPTRSRIWTREYGWIETPQVTEPIRLITHTAKGSPDGNTFTTDGIDTSRANLIIVAVGSYEAAAEPAISDSYGNDWSNAALTAQSLPGTGRIRFFYIWGRSENPGAIGGPGHTFTLTGTGFFGSVAVVAYAGAASHPFDVQNGATTASGTSLQPGSVTPTRNNELVVTALGFQAVATTNIDSGYSIQETVGFSAGVHSGLSIATRVQTTAVATNPTWGWSVTTEGEAVIATFRASAEVQAADMPDLWSGSVPSRSRLFLGPRIPLPIAPPEVGRFPDESTIGSRPSSPRLFMAPRSMQPSTTHAHVTAFSLEQVIGAKSDRFRELLPTKSGLQVSQTTHVQNAFTVDMVQGWTQMPQPFQSLDRYGLIAIPPGIDAFTIEQVRGWMPESPRLFLKPQGLSVSQPTHVQNAFAVDMIQGWKPERQWKQDIRPRFGWSWFTPEVFAFSVEMAQGSRPERARVLLGTRIPLPESQPTHVQAAFGEDMVGGNRPDRNREYLPLRIGWAQSQLTHVDAAFTPSMVLVVHQDRYREFLPLRIGWLSSQPTHVQAAFTQEMIAGAGVDRNRERLTPRMPHAFLPPDVFAFGIEMVRGSIPERARILLGARIPLPTAQTTHISAALTTDMVAGWAPVSGKRYLGKIGLSEVAQEFGQMTPEMWGGSSPASPRIFLAPRIGLSPGQPTHVQAAFTADMVQGNLPSRARLFVVKLGSSATPDVPLQMTPEVFAGWHPDKNRAFLPPKLGWNTAQLTHVNAPFGTEMVAGAHPDKPRIFLHPNSHLFPYFWMDVVGFLVAVSPDVFILVGSDIGAITVGADVGFILMRSDTGGFVLVSDGGGRDSCQA
jgi:hypothetical protein